MSSTVVALLSSIESTQAEIISCIIAQILEFIPDAYIVDFYKDEKMNRVLGGQKNVIKMNQHKYDKWSSIYRHYKSVIKEADNVILIKTPILRGDKYQLTSDKLCEIDDGIINDDTYCMQYDKIKRLIDRILFVKACRNKNVYQYVLDVDEVNFSDVWNFKKYIRIGACNWNGVSYFPMYEYILANTYIQEIPKAEDVYYIGSNYDGSRDWLYTYRDQMKERIGSRRVMLKRNNPTTGKFEIFSRNDTGCRVAQTTYYYNLMLSRFTVITPPYNESEFNMVRFMEAVILGCVPVILPNVNLDGIRLTFPDIYDIIKKDKVVLKKYVINGKSACTYPIEYFLPLRVRRYEEYAVVIDKIKSTKSYKSIIDRDYIQECFNNLFEVDYV